MKIFGKNKKKNNRGFSLIESMVAITVAITAIVGPMMAAQRSLVSASYAKDQVIAIYLAGEAVEYIQYLRSDNSNKATPWLSGLDFCLGNDIDGEPNQCGIDASAEPGEQVVSCVANNNCQLNIENLTGIYGHRRGGDWKISKFNRKIHIDVIVPNQEIKVSSTVSWLTPPLGSRTFTVTDYLMNWRRVQ